MMHRVPKMTWISGFFVLIFLLCAFFAPWVANEPGVRSFQLYPIGPDTPPIAQMLDREPPGTMSLDGRQYILGTDHVGRDLFARIVHGIRNSLLFALAVVSICIFLGIVLGGIMGLYGGKVDLILQRFMEIVGNFPIFLLQLTLLAFFERNYWILLFVMILAGWIPYCRFVRAEFLKLRSQDFVQSAYALGASRFRIFRKHLLPNSLTPVITFVPFDLAQVIVVLGALSFLGFGEPIDQASLGELLRQAKDNFRVAWWIAVFPASAIFLLTLSLALFGSSIRDLLDPRYAEN
ncbi:MAG: ABC transporter permease [Bradymonadales bacterium]|nr:MAG: ABC transporter permease [Bradymonadales bacterium]